MSPKQFLAKLSNLILRGRAERDLNREIDSHLALMQDDFERRGLNPREARMAARRAYGGVEQAKELHRDERSFVWLEQLAQDVRHAGRSLRKSPGFVSIAVLSLALGIGVNTAIFTLVNGILLKKLPIPNPDRVVQIKGLGKSYENSGFPYPVWRQFSRQTAIFQSVTGFSRAEQIAEWNGNARKAAIELVTGNYFSFFDARPALGRLIDEEDDRVEGAHPVCVLSYAAWQGRFGGDVRVLDAAVRINGAPFQIVGVAPPDFVGAEVQRRYDMWIPSAMRSVMSGGRRDNPNSIWINALARLTPGISLAQANARLKVVSGAIEDTLPREHGNAGEFYQVREAAQGADEWRSTLRDPLFVLMGAVSLVLLVACANLANLLLARLNDRRQEFAIKLSLGISRWRLLRQLVIESLLLAAGGGGLAILISGPLIRFLLGVFNAGKGEGNLQVAPDATVLLFTLGVCLLTTLLAGVYPAWRASRTEASPGLKGMAPYGLSRSFVRRGLILVQVGLAVVLLFGASLFGRSLRQLKAVDLGFDIDHILTVQIGSRGTPSPAVSAARLPQLDDVLVRVRQLSGVEAAAFASPAVLTGGMMMGPVLPKDPPGGAAPPRGMVDFLFAGPGYFSTLRIPLLRGRDFSPTGNRGAPLVGIVNQSVAKLRWPGQNPIGKRFDAWGRLKDIEIIGVVGDSRYKGIREKMQPIAYLAFNQIASDGALEIRTRAAFPQIESEVRQIVKTSAPDYQVSDASSLELLRDELISQDRLLAFLSSLFGVLGTVLALVGIYGLIAYSVTRRIREIGVRISVGAQRTGILWLFLREAAILLAAGIALGLPLALCLSRFLEKMLYQVTTSDPWGMAVTVALLALGGLTASVVPARRATRIDPVQALRYD